MMKPPLEVDRARAGGAGRGGRRLRALAARKAQQASGARRARQGRPVVELAATDVVQGRSRELQRGLPVSGSLRP
jgi:hypothetical protein